MKFETSWDDGGKYDTKLTQLLKKYNLQKYSTFYIPLNCEIGLENVKWIAQDFEIGSHTINHPQDLKLLEGEFLDAEVIHSKGLLESVIAKPVEKFCYPRGRYDDFVKARVKEAGYKEARTTVVLATDEGEDLFAKPTTIHCFQRKEYKGKDWYDLAIEMFAKAKLENKYFHIWGHSIELQRSGEWGKLEELFGFFADHLKDENINTK